MDIYEALNKLFSAAVVICWALMIFAPRAKVTRWVLHSDAVPLAISVAYLAVIVPWLPALFGTFDSLDEMMVVLSNKPVFFTGWIHYLAFDLIVGRVILSDAQQRGIPHPAVVPCLLLTFLLGPVGYGLYAVVRVALRRAAGAVAPLPSLPGPHERHSRTAMTA